MSHPPPLTDNNDDDDNGQHQAASLSLPAQVNGLAEAEQNRMSLVNDDDIDIIGMIQERDAYKLETEKLRKIIERQRFIIKSLQDQLSRKQSISTLNTTPTLSISEMTPEPTATAAAAAGGGGDSVVTATTTPIGTSSVTSRDINNDKTSGMQKNALGLSSLSNDTTSSSAAAMETQQQQQPQKSSDEPRDSVEDDMVIVNARPWAKSTRLSEIYADYSARHNSVTPMFKTEAASSRPMSNTVAPPRPTAASVAVASDNDSATKAPTPANGQSFTESLQTSIHRVSNNNNNSRGWSADWDTNSSDHHHTDNKRISSMVLESSREPSMSLDSDGRPESLRPTDLPECTFQHTSKATVPSVARVETRAKKEKHTIDFRASGMSWNGGNSDIEEEDVGNTQLASSHSNKDSQNSPTAQDPADLLVLRPMSMHGNGGQHVTNPVAYNNEGWNRDWEEAEMAGYEYVGSPMATSQHKQEPAKPFNVSPSFGPAGTGDNSTTNQPQHHSTKAGSSPYATKPVVSSPAQSTTDSGQNLSLFRKDSTPFGRTARSPSSNSQGSSSIIQSQFQQRQQLQQQRADVYGRQVSNSYHDDSSSVVSALPVPHNRDSEAYSAISDVGGGDQPPKITIPLQSLRGIDIQIKDSRVKVDERGKEVNVYMVDIIHRKEISGLSLQEILIETQQAQAVLWTVEKRYSDFLNLNSQLRNAIQAERIDERLERLPDKEIFRPNAPTKNDKRKLWFERYLKKALSLPVNDNRTLLEFLSTDRVMEPEKNMPILLGHKEGYLVKKGKNFGGWKRRYYVCKSNQPVLEYFETPGANAIGTINLAGAVVKTGKSQRDTASSRSKEAEMFRHAFLIEEKPKKEGKDPISHPLWADSDRERDEWVMALRYVIVRDTDGPERAMREVTKYADYIKNKESNLLMIHQIQTSITHEQGARQSIEYNRRKEEMQRLDEDEDEVEMGAMSKPGAGLNDKQKIGGSPLRKPAWPTMATASLSSFIHGGRGRENSNGSDNSVVVSQPASSANMGSNTSVYKQSQQQQQQPLKPPRPHRPRSISLLQPKQNADTLEGKGGVNAASKNSRAAAAATAKTTPNATVFAATLSASFPDNEDAELNDQVEQMSINYAPSEISTIESSIYSSYNGNDSNGGNNHNGTNLRAKDMSLRSIDDQNSYGSVPDSPLSPLGNPGVAATSRATHITNFNNGSDVGPLAPHSKSTAAAHHLVHANSASQISTRPPHTTNFPAPSDYSSGGVQRQQPSSQTNRFRAQFTKDSTGRIVYEEDQAPDLPENTPRVTDDILGVGRQQDTDKGSGKLGGKRSRTREEKKRGRITFMWGKRKQAEHGSNSGSGHPTPDAVSSEGSSVSSAANEGSGGAAASSSSALNVPRKLRRGSVSHHDSRNHQHGKQTPFKGPIFGLALERAVEMTKIRPNYHLPAVVYRCIEYLDARKAWMEEGIYRMSSSKSALEALRSAFDNNRDYNLLKLSKPPDVHSVACLLKEYCRELPEKVLTQRLAQDFSRVVDMVERRDRVHELGRLVSELPLANYTLLRAIIAHLIRIVRNATVNRMTLRNIGIVVPLSLNLPVGVFNLLMVEFEYIFWVNDSGAREPKTLSLSKSTGAAVASSMSVSQPLQQPGSSPLSVSVPSGMDRAQDEDYISSAGTDVHSLASDGHSRRYMYPTQQQKMRQTSSNQSPLLDSELVDSLDMSRDLSRYPGIPKIEQQQQQQQQSSSKWQSGRSNRNSIQYAAGAPREMIFGEAGFAVPPTISEDDDDDLSLHGDPMMRLGRFDSDMASHQ